MPLAFDGTRWSEYQPRPQVRPAGGLTPYAARQEYLRSSRRGNVINGAVLPTVAAFGGGAALSSLASIGAGGGAAGAGATAGASLPSAATAGMIAPSVAGPVATNLSAAIPWLRLSEIGAGAGFNLFGAHQAGKAASRAHALELEGMRQQQANFERQYALEREAFEADQEQQRLDRAAVDDDRAYTRKLSDEREGRRGPYRAIGRNALYSLADIARVRSY